MKLVKVFRILDFNIKLNKIQRKQKSLILNAIQRVVVVDKITFIDNNNKEIAISNILSQITTNSTPRYANVYFTIQSTDTKYNNKHYVAQISYSFFINRNTKNTRITLLKSTCVKIHEK